MKKILLNILVVFAMPAMVMAQTFQLPNYTSFTLPNGLVGEFDGTT